MQVKDKIYPVKYKYILRKTMLTADTVKYFQTKVKSYFTGVFFLALIFLGLFGLAESSSAELWTGILSANRAIDWSGAGMPSGTPDSTTICSTLSPGATVAQINSTIASCPSGQVVYLNAGTYTLSGKILFNRDSVTLRGAGADQTLLRFSAGGGCGNNSCVVHFSQNGQWSGGPQHTASFLGAGNPPVSGTYTKGATQILVNSNANMSVGDILILDQLDDSSDTGNVYICGRAAADCSSEGQASGGGRNGNRAMMQFAEITAINGTTISILQPLYMPTWRTSQSPGMWWTSAPQKYAGIENLTVDATGSAAGTNILFENANYCWVKGVKSLKQTGARAHIEQQYSSNIVVRDSYLFGSAGSNLSYGIETWMSGNALIENNIIEQGVAGFLMGAGAGSVFAYNYIVDQNSNSSSWLFPGTMEHDPGTVMNLYEGNDVYSMMQDAIHGSHAMSTFFRNRSRGYDDTQSMQTVPMLISSYSRYANIIGGVLGRGGYHTNYQANSNGSSSSCNVSIYNMGWGSTQCGNGSVNADSLAVTTAMRWGNYDVVTGVPRWESSEVPMGAPSYPNFVPASQTLPNSFYLSAKPSSWWGTPWGTPAWPPIGPDVTGGNISEGIGNEAALDGHAYKIPARLCYENTSKTNGVLNFNANNCYASVGGGDTTPPAAPSGLSVQ